MCDEAVRVNTDVRKEAAWATDASFRFRLAENKAAGRPAACRRRLYLRLTAHMRALLRTVDIS